MSGMHRMPALLVLAAVASGAAHAQAPPPPPPPPCTPAREGVVACLGERLCRSRWEPGGALTGRPPGFRWDCGALRPSCGVVPPGPDAPAPPWLPLPLGR